MSRNVAGWVLIAFGLAGIFGGAGMAYVFWVANETAAQNARAQGSMNPNGFSVAPPRQNEAIIQYGSALLSGVVGLVLALWGVGLRGSGPTERGKKKSWKRKCPNCGEATPKTATNCFHCGGPV